MTLSIAMSTYNGAAFLAEQLDSIAHQSRPPDELIVCDDRSTDATLEILRRFADAAAFPVRVHLNEPRLGSSRNAEAAATRCSGDIIACCDQDDYWMPSKLARIERTFERPEVGLVFSDAEIVDERLCPSGERLWRRLGLDASARRVIEGPLAPLTIDALLPGALITGATMAFRSKFRDVAFPIPLDLPLAHDGWIAVVVSALAEVRGLDEPLIRYRQHTSQQVGARPPRASAAGLLAGLGRATGFAGQIAVVERLRDRLTSSSAIRPRPGVVARLDDRLRHLRVRSTLPARAVARLGPVAVELAAGRYHRYSRGVLSAAKDAVQGTK